MALRSLGPIAGLLCVALPAVAQTSTPITAFVNVSVIPMDTERVLAKQTVVVQGDRITAMGPTGRIPIPANAVQVDGRGKFLIPGLADMHNHHHHWFEFLANGITTVRDPGGKLSLDLRTVTATEQALRPRIYSAPSVNWSAPTSEAARHVAQLKAEGYDAVKMPVSSESPAVYDSVMAAARRANIAVVGHVPDGRNLEQILSDKPWASIEHLTGYFEYVIGVSGRWSTGDAAWFGFDHQRLVDTAAWMKPTFKADESLRNIATLTQRAGIWNCPTLIIMDRLVQELQRKAVKEPKYKPLLATSQQYLALNLQITKALQDAGAGLLLGTDADAFSIHRELQLMVQAGLTPYQALAAGTRNAATFLGTLDSAGTITTGKWADLVLLDRNPLKDIRSTIDPAGVMIAGQWVPRTEITARLDSLAAKDTRLAERRRAIRE